ncbi:hypothetical protein VKT23_011253 [Stygiomarasmius scandens]|uniref:Protein kinase domain-containing protein n=1 Tax=Marasmiellus scandens TaxID=2682957 RepID=A0ABR1JD18_9AGAR
MKPGGLKIGHDSETLQRLIETSDSEFRRLPLDSTVKDFFSQGHLDPYAIHVFLCPTAFAFMDEDDSGFESLKRSRLAQEAPASISKHEAYINLQKVAGERILDDRPEADDIPPPALLYSGFGIFQDILRGEDSVPSLQSVDQGVLAEKAELFCNAMVRFFDNQDQRRDRCLECLKDIFSASGKQYHIAAASMGPIQSDGHSVEKHRAIVFVQVKNEDTNNQSNPRVQMTSYFAHSLKHLDSELFLKWRVPGLGLTLVGCTLTFHALIAIDSQVRTIPLTPGFSCLLAASDGDDRQQLIKAFTAGVILIAQIENDANRLLQSQSPPIPRDCRRFPSITQLPCHANDGVLEFEYITHAPNRQPHVQLYLARLTGNSEDSPQVLVKFTKSYSLDLHLFCQQRGYAPKVLGFGKIPGGYYGLVMEYIQNVQEILASPLLRHRADEWKNQLMKLVDAFHQEGLVHGDIRAPNVVCDEDGKLFLLDYDWGGKDGKVMYPMRCLNPILTKGRIRKDFFIDKEDDRRILQVLIEQIDRELS